MSTWRVACTSGHSCAGAGPSCRNVRQTVLQHNRNKTLQAPAPGLQRGTTASSSGRKPQSALRAHRVEIETESGLVVLEMEPGETILQAALDQGVDLSHDCKMGVCMTCPAKLVSGQVDQSAGMLDEGAKAKGYALLCVSEPQSDCRIRVIDEDEIQEQMLCSSENV